MLPCLSCPNSYTRSYSEVTEARSSACQAQIQRTCMQLDPRWGIFCFLLQHQMQALGYMLLLREVLKWCKTETEEQLRYQATQCTLCNASLQRDTQRSLASLLAAMKSVSSTMPGQKDREMYQDFCQPLEEKLSMDSACMHNRNFLESLKQKSR